MVTARVQWEQFNCSMCARGPHLMAAQGCEVPAPRPFFKAFGMEFNRCPVRFQDPRAHVLMVQVTEGFLKASSYHERMSIPTKRLAALRYLEALIIDERPNRS